MSNISNENELLKETQKRLMALLMRNKYNELPDDEKEKIKLRNSENRRNRNLIKNNGIVRLRGRPKKENKDNDTEQPPSGSRFPEGNEQLIKKVGRPRKYL